jgi:peptidoglycan/LPS O-acetylase OafA/YrhL
VNLLIGKHIKSSIKSTTRIDEQVIRGFAVVIVVLYHLKIGVMQSGYVGVDIFFVLSRYFIYEKIRDYQNFAQFIKARIKRIYPSLLMITLSTYTFAYYFLSDLDRFKKIDFIASILFLENIKLLFESTNYFRSEFNPFIHLWTIAIELQFYIMAFFLIKKYKFNIFILLIISFSIWIIFYYRKM